MGKMSLIIVVGFNIIFMAMGFNLAGVASQSYSNYTKYYQVEQAQFLAESAANVAIGSLYQNNNWLYGDNDAHNHTLYYDIAKKYTLGTYSFQAKRTYPNGNAYVTFYICSQYGNALDSTIVTCNIPAYSSFAMYTCRDVSGGGTLIGWWTGETCNGKLHADSILYIGQGNTPHFNGAVTVGNSVRELDGNDNDVGALTKTDSANCFKQGLTYGEKLGWVNSFDGVKNVAGYDSIPVGPITTYSYTTGSGHSKQTVTVNYQADVYVQFNSDGTIDVDTGGHVMDASGWTAISKKTTHMQHLTISAMTNPVLGIMSDSSQSHLHVRGTLNGKVTVANLGLGNVYIDSSIVYKDTSSNLLGLVARDTMYVTDDSINNVGQVTIQGALLASTFTAQNYGDRDSKTSTGSTSDQGILKLYGSLAQQSRGIVGQNGNGFLKNYTYDWRFAGSGTAPSFPTLPYFQIASWYDKINWSTDWWNIW